MIKPLRKLHIVPFIGLAFIGGVLGAGVAAYAADTARQAPGQPDRDTFQQRA